MLIFETLLRAMVFKKLYCKSLELSLIKMLNFIVKNSLKFLTTITLGLSHLADNKFRSNF